VDLLPTATSTDEGSRRSKLAVLPVGSFEQHGAHLPLITDTIVACTLAKSISDKYNLFLLPPITISCSHEHAAFAGTVSIRAKTLQAVVNDIYSSLAGSGIFKLLIVNGHGGNYVLSNIVQELNEHEARVGLFPDSASWSMARQDAGMATTQHDDMHAGELESSVLLAYAKDTVRDSQHMTDHLAGDRPHLLTTGMAHYSSTGVIGRPSLGDPGKGRLLVNSLATRAGDILDLLLKCQ
jgi:creatinine amidohydrolase